jgi:hypothetical protein
VLQADRNSIELLIAKIVRSFFILSLRQQGRITLEFSIFWQRLFALIVPSSAAALAEAFKKIAGAGSE